MSILIKTVERSNPQDREAAPKYYPTVASRGTIDIDGLTDQISMISSLSRGDVYSAILSLLDIIPKELLDGKMVKLGKLGSLSLNLDAEGADSADKVTADKVKSVHIVFRPSQELKDDLTHFSIRTS
jgi:predicted histone-like DNA-binding protein